MTDADTAPESSSTDAEPPIPSRRTAVQVLTGFLGLLLNLIPAGIGGLFFLDPILGRRGQSGAGSSGSEGRLQGYVKLTVNTDAIPQDGAPVAVTVISDLTDAWNMYQDVPIGSIWVRRQEDGSLLAFNSICPHLGCSVDYRSSEKDFYCPCHTSAFDLNGERTNNIPPRGMDGLEIATATDGEPDENGTELWVKFQDFRGGTDQKIPV